MRTGGTTPRSIASASAHVLQGADNGMTCDGVTDDGPALQAVVNRVSTGTSADIRLPHGICLINTAVTATKVVHLNGQGWGESAVATGTTFATSNTAITPLTFSGSTNLANPNGSSVRDVAFTQVQPPPVAGWAPTVYPPFIQVTSSDGFKGTNLLAKGVYDFINLQNSARYTLNGIEGQVFHNAVKVDDAFDIGRIDNVNLWPYWLKYQNVDGASVTGNAVMAWQQANLDAVILGRQDGAFVDDVFVFAARSAVRFIAGPNGFATNIELGKIDCDSTVHCLYVTGVQGTSAKLQEMNAFGQRGVSSGQPYSGSNAIMVDSTSSLLLQGGDVRSGLTDTNTIELDNPNNPSTLYLHTIATYQVAGASGSSVIQAVTTASGVPPHIVGVDQPLNISLRSGSYLAGVNWGSTNAVVRNPGLDYQIIESPTAAAFAGNSYAIENARPKLVIEADDGHTISFMTIRLPKYSYDGMEAVITSTVPVTEVTINDPNGWPVIGAPASLTANAPIRFKWTNTGSQIVWFRQ